MLSAPIECESGRIPDELRILNGFAHYWYRRREAMTVSMGELIGSAYSIGSYYPAHHSTTFAPQFGQNAGLSAQVSPFSLYAYIATSS